MGRQKQERCWRRLDRLKTDATSAQLPPPPAPTLGDASFVTFIGTESDFALVQLSYFVSPPHCNSPPCCAVFHAAFLLRYMPLDADFIVRQRFVGLHPIIVYTGWSKTVNIPILNYRLIVLGLYRVNTFTF